MASRKRSLSDFRDASGAVKSSFVDDARYRESVLLLEPDQDEDSLNAALVDEARQLGLITWNPQREYDCPPLSDFVESTGTRTPPHTSSSASVRQPSTANTSALQIPESVTATVATATVQPTPYTFPSSSSYKDPVPSRHSVISSSTCPPLCSCQSDHKPPSLSSTSARAEKPPSTTHNGNNRYSLDPRRQSTSNMSFYSTSTASSRRPDSSDSRIRSGLKHAFLHFPPFKKRASVDSTALSRASSCLECQNQNLQGSDVEYRKSSAPDVEEQGWVDPVKQVPKAVDEEAIFRSLACPPLLTMRSSQESQKHRHHALRQDLVGQMDSMHREQLENQRSESQKAEQELAERNSEKAARAEERQLSAELSLLDDFRREKLALQSGIHHMEAYFNTPTPAGTSAEDSPNDSDSVPSQRQYTQQHRDRLQQKYHERDSIDTLHESKIKVLRDKQAKQSEEAARKMEREAADLAESNGQRYRELEKQCRDEEAATLEWLETKEKRLVARWTLEEAVLRKKLELESGVPYGPLPPLVFEGSQT